MVSTRKLFKAVRSAYSIIEKPLYARRFRSTATLILPDFLGIGAQKAGTTWLYENLRCHPALYLPEKKELHYFDSRFHESLRSYSNRFRAGADKSKGEITPAYGILPLTRIRFIGRIMPAARLVFLMRNPIERAWSHAVMNLATERDRRIEDVPDTDFYTHFQSEASVQRSDYLTILQNWLAVFAREQLFIGFFEDIADRPKELLGQVFEHLRVSRDVHWDQFPHARMIRPQKGSGLVVEEVRDQMPARYREILRRMYRSQIEELQKRFGGPIEGWS